MLLIHKRNKGGPKTVPRGTLPVTVSGSQRDCIFTLTHCAIDIVQRHSMNLLLFLNEIKRWYTVPKTLDRSKTTRNRFLLIMKWITEEVHYFNYRFFSKFILSNARLVLRILFLSQNCINLSLTLLSKMFGSYWSVIGHLIQNIFCHSCRITSVFLHCRFVIHRSWSVVRRNNRKLRKYTGIIIQSIPLCLKVFSKVFLYFL